MIKLICDTEALNQQSPGQHSAADRDKFRQRRSGYDGNGEYEFVTAPHYVPRYWPKSD